MNYLEFFLLFFVPWTLIELVFALRRNTGQHPIFLAIIVVALANILYLIPLKHLEVQWGIVQYNQARSFFLIAGTPIEIYLYLLMAGVFCGLLFYFIRPRLHREDFSLQGLRILSTTLCLALLIFGLVLVAMEKWELLGMTCVWATLPLLFSWSIGVNLAWRTRGALLWSTLLSTIVLSSVEILALRFSLISFDATKLTGASLLGLPFERYLFIFLFNFIVCNVLEVFWRHYREIGRPLRTAGV